jgi:galactokinase
MTGHVLAARLADQGLEPLDGTSKRPLFESVIQRFRLLRKAPPTHGWWVPGRIEVFGKHTDYAGGHTLVAALPRGFAVVAAARPDGVVRLFDSRRQEEFAIDPSGDRPSDGWRNYAQVVVRRLAANFPRASLGADIVFASDLPSASGMSSSSALIIGTATALADVAGLTDRPEWRDNVMERAGAAGYYACIENGMTFGALRGDAGVGTHGGSKDHVAILCGAPGHLSAWRFVGIHHICNVKVPESWTFVVAASGVAARKTGPAKEAYNRLSREATALLDLWNRSEPARSSLRDALASTPSARDRLVALVHRSGLEEPAAAALERRLEHFVREDARVLHAVGAFRDAARARVGALADVSQADAEALLENQVPETIALARSARDLGAFAASSFGAGFGGSVWALVEQQAASEFARRWLADYTTRYPDRSGATAFIARPGPSLTRLFPEGI